MIIIINGRNFYMRYRNNGYFKLETNEPLLSKRRLWAKDGSDYISKNGWYISVIK